MKILHDDVASIIYYSSGWMLLLMGFIVHFFTVAFMMHIIFEKQKQKNISNNNISNNLIPQWVKFHNTKTLLGYYEVHRAVIP